MKKLIKTLYIKMAKTKEPVNYFFGTSLAKEKIGNPPDVFWMAAG